MKLLSFLILYIFAFKNISLISFSIIVLEQLVSHHQQKNLDINFASYKKFKMDDRFKCKTKNYQTVKGQNLY